MGPHACLHDLMKEGRDFAALAPSLALHCCPCDSTSSGPPVCLRPAASTQRWRLRSACGREVGSAAAHVLFKPPCRGHALMAPAVGCTPQSGVGR